MTSITASISPPEPSLRGEMRRILRLSVPNIGTTVGRMLMGFIDFVMVAGLGTQALAALSPATLLIFCVLCIGLGTANATTTFAAQALGRGDRANAAVHTWQAVYVSVAFAVVSGPLVGALCWIVTLFGHEPAVQAAELAYVRIAIWSVAPSVVVSGLDGFFNGVQRPAVSMIGVGLALVTNGLLSYGLIYGHWGLPRMGVGGSALAAVMGWSLRAVYLFAIFLTGRFAAEFATRRTWRPHTRRIIELLRIGLPLGLQRVLEVSAWVVFLAWIVASSGPAAMAATNIVVQYCQLSFMPAVGVGLALTSLVGHAIGEGRPELAVLRTRAAALIMIVYMGMIGLLFCVARSVLIRPLSDDPAVLERGRIVLLWAAGFQMFDALGIAYGAALTGAGDTRWPTIAFVAYSWGVFILGGWLVVRHWPGWGLNGPWLMCNLYIALLGVTLAWRFSRGPWRTMRLSAGPSPPYALPTPE